MKTTTIVFTLTALLFVAFAVFVDPHLKTTDEARESSRILAPVKAGSIAKIRVSRQSGKSVLTKDENGDWRLTEPLEDQLDPGLMKILLDDLSHLAIRETIRRDELGRTGPTLDELGFAAAESLKVTLEFDNEGAEPLELLFGANSAIDGALYVQTPETRDRPDVYLVDTTARLMLENPPGVLRDRRILRLHPGAIRGYVLRTHSGEIELERELKAPRWYIIKPLQTRANDDIAYSLLEEIVGLTAELIVDDAPPAAADPVAPEAENTAVIELHPQNGEPIEVVLRQEAPANPEDPVVLLATVSGRKATFKLANDLVSRLPTNANQLRNPHLTDFDPKMVARVQIQTPTSLDVDLIHDGSSWLVVIGGQPQKANSRRVEGLIAALNAEPIVEFVSDTASQLDEFGLEPPAARISVTATKVDADELKTYQEAVAQAKLNGTDPNKAPKPNATVETKTLRFGRAGGGLLNANVEGSPFIFGISPAFLAVNVPTHPIRWRSTRLPSFNLLSIRGISLEEAGQPPFSLRYDYLSNEWTGKLGERTVDEFIDRRQAERLARHVGSLEVLEWQTDLAPGLKALDRPSCLVRIKIAHPEDRGPNPREIQFGIKFAPAAFTGDRISSYYGQLEGHPDVFLFSAESYDQIVAPVLTP